MLRKTRRDAIALGAVGTLTAACGGFGLGGRRHVAVIGAGIVGASIAYHLAKAGAQVTVLERDEIAGHASRGTFAWLNATWAKQPRHYHRLNQLGLAAWQTLQRELSIPIKWGGSIEWFDSAERMALLERQVAEQVEWGEPTRLVGRAELAALEPKVDFGSTQTASFSPNDGAVDPVLAATRFIEQAKRLGADVRTSCGVNGVRKSGGDGRLVLDTGQGGVAADFCVLATGADPQATEAFAGIKIPQRSTPGVIAVTKPHRTLLNRVVVAPGVHIHQRLDGRIVLGEQDGPPDNEAHATRLAGRPNRFPIPELAQQHGQRILAVAERYLPEVSEAAIEDVVIGWRPLPLDGLPVMGFSLAQPGAYIAISHSGVSLAPILGRLAAQEILEGLQAEALAPYRPDRKFVDGGRY